MSQVILLPDNSSCAYLAICSAYDVWGLKQTIDVA